MPIMECVLKWLEHFKPLWDFLTAVGTVGLAAVTFYLATRVAKVHLALTISLMNENQTIVVTVTNDAKAVPVLLKCVWRTREFEFARVDYQIGMCQLNGHPTGYGAQRLVNGDVLTIWAAVQEIARQADASLPKDLAPNQLDRLVRESSIAWATSTGDSFSMPLPPDVQTVLANRIKLIRTPI